TRFERESNSSVHWSAADPTVPPGPTNPPPPLWHAPASAVPESGNYLYVESDPEAYSFLGWSGIVTGDDIVFTPANYLKGARMDVTGPSDRGEIVVLPMFTQTRLVPGY